MVINGQVVDTIAAGTGALVPNYQTAEFTFIAPANGEVTFGFQSLSSDSFGVIIDNLRIEAVELPVPEITNPSFEQPVVNTWALITGGSGALPGWSITSENAEIDRTPWPAAEGNQSMDLNGTKSSSIEQVVNGFASGGSYSLVVDFALHSFAKTGATAEVLINDEVIKVLSATTAAIAPNYQAVEIPFIASGGAVKLGFKGLGQTSTGVVIDNIRLKSN